MKVLSISTNAKFSILYKGGDNGLTHIKKSLLHINEDK